MVNDKLDSILNLSLETEPEVREKSDILSNGYDFENNIWEVIIKYNGDISLLETEVESLEILLNGYAIMRATRAQLERVLDEPRIEYVELPKSLVFNTYQAKLQSCILPIATGVDGLRGSGVLTAVIDSGIQYLLNDFQNENGSRILYLWDQTLVPDASQGFLPPEGFSEGVEFTKKEIDRAIRAAGLSGTQVDIMRNQQRIQGLDIQAALQIVPSRDTSGHGTAVAGITAGSAVSPLYQGVAPESDLLIVKVGGNRARERRGVASDGQVAVSSQDTAVSAGVTPSTQNFPLTTDLMRAIAYVLQKAEELGKPVAVNISIGDTYGAHDGTSLLERFIDAASEKGRNSICIGSGNEAVTGGHRTVRLFGTDDGQRMADGSMGNPAGISDEVVELSIAPNERSMNVQIWKNYVDTITLELAAPSGERYPVLLTQTGKQEWITGNTRVLVYVSPPTPYSVNEEIFFDFIPMNQFIDNGIWTFTLRPVGENRQDIHFFLPNAVVRNSQTRFLRPDPYLSMTIPAFASRAITVGAYDGVLNAAADFSGRDREIGETERVFFAADIKPDIAAPGVGITAPSTDGQYRSFTGTSFATPIVTGSAALLLEWGIVRGNDPFLYGEKLKAYLRKGARPLLDTQLYPNIRTGYGALCVRDSIIT